ncbi:MAG: DAK2 domain-containing protein [Clostridiales bacterium]|nr:DAK2 domain-containing protein [Clostridiales bacterium]
MSTYAYGLRARYTQKENIFSVANERKTIDGALFEKMILGGVANLQKNAQKVNDLNVFPIPDGDTGENMYLTLQSGLNELLHEEKTAIADKAHAMAQGMLLGARGNSGVILSQLFFGLSEGLKGQTEATVIQLGEALKQGVKCAYGAVAHPVEGTILTVAREAVENICAQHYEDMTVEEFFGGYLVEMKKSLEKTPNLLAVLKEAGVIDSGGAGLVYITEGFCKTLGGEKVEGVSDLASGTQKAVDLSKFDENSVMEFGYCTELLLRLQKSKTDVENFSVDELVAYLETIGDSVVAFKTGTIIKLHVHTMTPYMVLQYCQKYGEYLTVKIENMTLQHNEVHEESATESAIAEEVKMPKRARRPYATVTVAAGAGLRSTFLEMGADYVISGGQTNNPSSEDFIKAFDTVNADCVFVLPNNGNIVMAAKQAASIYTDSEIRVIESKNIGQGYSALAMVDYELEDADAIQAQMEESMAGTVTGMVARAVRTTELNGVKVEKDGYMGFTDHTMLLCQPTKTEAVCSLIEKLGVAEKEFLIVVYGNGVTDEEKDALRACIEKDYTHVEMYEIEGGQDVYDFLLIIE